MAQEITAGANLAIALTGQSVSGSTSVKFDLAGEFFGEEQSIATSSTALNMNGVTAPKALYIRNLDTTNYVEIDSVNTFNNFPQKIMPGAAALLFPETATIYAKANTASVQVWVAAG